MKFQSWLALGVSLPLFLMGCAPKQQVMSSPVVTPLPTDTPTQTAKITAHYRVKKGDSLWAISSRRRVFGDPFAWPLLYRENRDQIQDPDLIYPRQYLGYARKATARELEDARRIAKATPPYHPHRKGLPMQ